jgi:signal transduction histidine kinase
MNGPDLSSLSPESTAWAGRAAWLLTLLPVRNLATLLPKLAAGWSDAAAGTVLLMVPHATGATADVALGPAGEPVQLASLPLATIESPAPSDWVAAAAAAFPHREWPAPIRASFELQHAGRTLGHAILLGGAAPSLPKTTLEWLAELSARLIAQSRLNEPEGWQAELEAAKLESLAEFAAGAGHEINNPVATITGRVQLLLPGEPHPERRQALLTIGGQAHRIRDMIGDIMLFARPPRPHFSAGDLSQIVTDVAAKFHDEAAARQCRFVVTAPWPVPIWGDPVQIAIVVAGLIQNSLAAAKPEGILNVSATRVDSATPLALLVVSDDGAGLSPLEREHLFDPFYSGRQAGRGLGFGLAKAWRIVKQHGGTIHVASEPGETRFEVLWPAAP